MTKWRTLWGHNHILHIGPFRHKRAVIFQTVTLVQTAWASCRWPCLTRIELVTISNSAVFKTFYSFLLFFSALWTDLWLSTHSHYDITSAPPTRRSKHGPLAWCAWASYERSDLSSSGQSIDKYYQFCGDRTDMDILLQLGSNEKQPTNTSIAACTLLYAI